MSGAADEVIEAVSEQILKEVQTVYTSQGKLTDEILSALQFTFQAPLLPALDLVDKRNVLLINSPSGRSVYQVVGSSGTPYTCFTSSVYCSCPAYKFSVLQKEGHNMCKHTLAVRLAKSMGLCKELEVSNQELFNMITLID